MSSTAIVFNESIFKSPILFSQLVAFGKSISDSCRFLLDKEPVYCNISNPPCPLEFINTIISANGDWDIFVVYDKSCKSDSASAYLTSVLSYFELFSLYNSIRLNFIITDVISDINDIATILRHITYWQSRIHSVLFYNPWRALTYSEGDFIKISIGCCYQSIGYIPKPIEKTPPSYTRLIESYDIIGGYIGNQPEHALEIITKTLRHNDNRDNIPAGCMKAFYIEPEYLTNYQNIISKYQGCCIIKPGMSLLEFIEARNIQPSIAFHFEPSAIEASQNVFNLIDEIVLLKSLGYTAYSNCCLFNKRLFENWYPYTATRPSILPDSHHSIIRSWIDKTAPLCSFSPPTLDKGICFCVGGVNYSCELIVALSCIRQSSKSTDIPITIMYDGDELSEFQIASITDICNRLDLRITFTNLAPLIAQYKTLIDEFCLINKSKWTLRGFQIKQWALIFSPYRHTIIIDTDIIATSDINEWFTDMPKTAGIKLWKDYWRTSRHSFKSATYCSGQFQDIKLSIDRREWIYPLYQTTIPQIDNESGVMLVNKTDLDLSKFIAISIAYPYFNGFFYGDKDIYNLAFPVNQYYEYPGAITVKSEDNNTLLGMIQYDDNERIHHIHMTIKPFRGNSDDDTSKDQLYLNRLDETANLAPIINSGRLDFNVTNSQEHANISDELYNMISSARNLSREYYLLSLF